MAFSAGTADAMRATAALALLLVTKVAARVLQLARDKGLLLLLLPGGAAAVGVALGPLAGAALSEKHCRCCMLGAKPARSAMLSTENNDTDDSPGSCRLAGRLLLLLSGSSSLVRRASASAAAEGGMLLLLLLLLGPRLASCVALGRLSRVLSPDRGLRPLNVRCCTCGSCGSRCSSCWRSS